MSWADPGTILPWIDFAEHRLVFDEVDDWLHLAPQDLILLRAFAQKPGRLVTTEHLLHALYSGVRDPPEDPANVLRVLIHRLRRVIPWQIVTIHRVGYRLEGYGAGATLTPDYGKKPIAT